MDIAGLRESWAMVAKSGDEVPQFFYSHLFLSHPEVREMFPISMSAQRDKLVRALGRIVSNVDKLAEVTPFIEQLGRDHRRFSAVAEHYPAVGASLLATLGYFLGGAWTPQLAADWAEAYGLIAKVMVVAAEESEQSTPAWWRAEVTAVERRTMDVLVLQLRPEQPLEYLPGQSVAIEVPERPLLWRYYSMANAPRADATIELHVQLVPGGQVSTNIVRSLRTGHVLRLGAPIGDQLTLPDGARPDLLLIAGGTGLAPLRAVLEQVDREWSSTGSAPRVHLFHGARMPWDLYEHSRMTALANRPWFNYTPVVSDDASYLGTRGFVGSAAAQSQQWQGRSVLVCGSASMVDHTIHELARAGAPADAIRFDRFGAPGADAFVHPRSNESGDAQ
jgi:NAD(P)H-flavin reductase